MSDDKEACPKGGEHDYKDVSPLSDWSGETYECTKCGDRYKLYYEDMA